MDGFYKLKRNIRVLLQIILALALLALGYYSLIQAYAHTTKHIGCLDCGTYPYIYATILGILVAAGGIFVTILALLMARKSRQKQDTLRVLLDTRVSSYFQSQVELAYNQFPRGKKISYRTFESYKTAKDLKRRNARSALLYLLNYYEFIAAGIRKGNLDEEMLKETIRGILCGLVYDSSNIIFEIRVKQNRYKSYMHLTNLYLRWADKNSSLEWDREIKKKFKRFIP